MKNKSASIALACAIGAGLGSMLAIDFGAFWFLGLLIGGIAGYFIYDLPTVIKAIPRAWKFAMEKRKNFIPFLKSYMLPGITYVILFLVYVIFMSLFACKVESYYFANSSGFKLMEPFLGTFLCLASLFLSLATLQLRYPGIYQALDGDTIMGFAKGNFTTESHKYTGVIIIDWARKNFLIFGAIILFSPIVVILLSVYTGIRVSVSILFWLPKAGKEIGLFCGRFLWKLFKLIHSDLRLLVGINSCLGGFVGFYFHSVLVGILAGAVWGFISYYVISLKLLKLKPSH